MSELVLSGIRAGAWGSNTMNLSSLVGPRPMRVKNSGVKEDVAASGLCFGDHQVWRGGCNVRSGNESHPSKGQGHLVTITMMHAPLLSTSLQCSVHI